MRRRGLPLDAVVLAGGLTPYSEMGALYVQKVRELLRSGDFTPFSRICLKQLAPGALAAIFRQDDSLALGESDLPPDV